MISDKYVKALREVYRRLYTTGINWAVIGSTNMALQKMNVEPNSINVVMPETALEQIEEIFDFYITQPREKIESAISGWRIRAKLHDVEIDFIGEKEDGAYYPLLEKGKFTIIVEGDLVLACLELDAEAEACEKLGRKDDAKKIREFLKQNETSRKS